VTLIVGKKLKIKLCGLTFISVFLKICIMATHHSNFLYFAIHRKKKLNKDQTKTLHDIIYLCVNILFWLEIIGLKILKLISCTLYNLICLHHIKYQFTFCVIQYTTRPTWTYPAIYQCVAT
jgi:hypothetical protein